MVVSIGACSRRDEIGGETVEYVRLGATKAHEGAEVTALAAVLDPSRGGGGGGGGGGGAAAVGPASYLLLSAGSDGFLWAHRHAFCWTAGDDQSRPRGPVRVGSLQSPDDPFLSLASAVVPVRGSGREAVLLFVGGGNGWVHCFGALLGGEVAIDSPQFGFGYLASVNTGGGGGGTSQDLRMVSEMRVVNGRALVAGSTCGNLAVFDIHQPGVEVFDTPGPRPLPPIGTLDQVQWFKPRYTLNHLHMGTVDSIEYIGHTLFTSGGGDGLLKGLDVRTGQVLGTVQCHGGRDPSLRPSEGDTPKRRPRSKFKSSVVGNVLIGDSIVSLCRDGTLNMFDFSRAIEEDEPEKAKEGRATKGPKGLKY